MVKNIIASHDADSEILNSEDEDNLPYLHSSSEEEEEEDLLEEEEEEDDDEEDHQERDRQQAEDDDDEEQQGQVRFDDINEEGDLDHHHNFENDFDHDFGAHVLGQHNDVYAHDWVRVPDPNRKLVRDPNPEESASRAARNQVGVASRRIPPNHTQRPNRPNPPPRARSQSTRPYPEVVEPPFTSSRRPGKLRTNSKMSSYEDDYNHRPQYPNGPGYPRYSNSRLNPYPGHGQGHAENYSDAYMEPGDVFTQYDTSSRRNRNSMSSMPSSHHAPNGQDLMLVNPHQPYGYPGYSPYPHHYGYPQHPAYPPHHSSRSTPTPPLGAAAPAAAPSVVDEKALERLHALEELFQHQKQEREDRIKSEKENALRAEEDKLKSLEKLIMLHAAEQRERDKVLEENRKKQELEKKQAELKMLEAKKIADDKDREVKAAAEVAKLEAEKEAAKKAAEEREKWDKEMAELKKKHNEAEAAKNKLDEEVKKLRPGDSPVRFKDAVGRKFLFPWHICKTWKGTETLIHQAFSHIEKLGKQVAENQYDLIGPGGEIILPQVWETTIKPDMAISMHMWPEPKKPEPQQHHLPPLGPKPGSFSMLHPLAQQQRVEALRKLTGVSKSKEHRKSAHGMPGFEGIAPNLMAPPPRPPGLNPNFASFMNPPPPPPPVPGILSFPENGATEIVDIRDSSSKSSSKGKKKSSSKSVSWLGALSGSNSSKTKRGSSKSKSKSKKK